MKTKVDPRIRTLIENNVKRNFRSLFVIVGDHGRDQVVNLHYMISKATIKARPSVLWCYKKDLGFSSNQKKRMKKKQFKSKNYDEDNPFDQFISTTNIRFCYYKDTHKILGTTFGMLVIQDFEALTPNLLARTIETVAGGGAVVLLLKELTSLKQLYTMTMDVHKRFRTEAHSDVVARFNERFLLSLSSCDSCLVLNDRLQVLPISSKTLVIKPFSSDSLSPEESKELTKLKTDLQDVNPAGPLVRITSTADQARSLMHFIDAIEQKSLKTTVSLTAARGRGKSAALGLAIAAAVAEGYSNIFVTSPSPENLKTLFEFLFKGFDALGLIEHNDYDIIQATNPEFGKAIVRVNIFRSHRQTVQYVSPKDTHTLGQAELVVIDEAAAIPLPIVKKLLGPYLVFLSSTISGYEGTGRSLSLKLIKQLREQNASSANVSSSNTKEGSFTSTNPITNRTLREIELNEPIRYSKGDSVENWLEELLCLRAFCPSPNSAPHPSKCQLFYVSRDALFSYHKLSEEFLQRLMGLFVSSHYKNSPNDLQLLSDAPSHHIFVLCGPPDNEESLPDIFAAIQVSLEGQISHTSSASSFGESGDLIPWTLKQQFQDDHFPSLSGARIVRITTHPEYASMGYGSQALSLLNSYFLGEIPCIDIVDDKVLAETKEDLEKSVSVSDENKLLTETISPRKKLPPLLLDLSQRPAEHLHYLGTSFGLSLPLLNFWSKNGLKPVYLRQVANDITGEYSCIMLRKIQSSSSYLSVNVSEDWLEKFVADFRVRFSNLLSYEFRSFGAILSLSVFSDSEKSNQKPLTKTQLLCGMSYFDIRRLDAYAQKLVDYHLIVDLLPQLSRWVVWGKIPVALMETQKALIVAAGLQCKPLDSLAKELSIETNQVLALFNKSIRKITDFLKSILEKDAEEELEKEEENTASKIVEVTREEKGGNEEKEEKETTDKTEPEQVSKKERGELVKMLKLSNYSVAPSDKDIESITKGQIPNVINFKSNKTVKQPKSSKNTNKNLKRKFGTKPNHPNKKRKQ